VRVRARVSVSVSVSVRVRVGVRARARVRVRVAGLASHCDLKVVVAARVHGAIGQRERDHPVKVRARGRG